MIHWFLFFPTKRNLRDTNDESLSTWSPPCDFCGNRPCFWPQSPGGTTSFQRPFDQLQGSRVPGVLDTYPSWISWIYPRSRMQSFITRMTWTIFRCVKNPERKNLHLSYCYPYKIFICHLEVYQVGDTFAVKKPSVKIASLPGKIASLPGNFWHTGPGIFQQRWVL